MADIPAGNVYYYFKTKDELVNAAIDAHAHEITAMLASLERHRTPQARLKALIRAFTEQRELAAQSGCPHGSLCQELDKRDDDLQAAARRLIELPLDGHRTSSDSWADATPKTSRVALDLRIPRRLAAHEHVPRPDLMLREARRLERWIDSL